MNDSQTVEFCKIAPVWADASERQQVTKSGILRQASWKAMLEPDEPLPPLSHDAWAVLVHLHRYRPKLLLMTDMAGGAIGAVPIPGAREGTTRKGPKDRTEIGRHLRSLHSKDLVDLPEGPRKGWGISGLGLALVEKLLP